MEPALDPTAESQLLTVWVVDDNPTDVFVIREVLMASGLNLRIRIARDGQEALQYYREMDREDRSPCPALILLDLNLPKVAGFEVLRELRSGLRCNRTPVIVITSSSSDGDRVMARRLGADEYFQKPADLAAYSELETIVRRVLGAAQQSQEA
ncbi:MAG TPA: response regulator [Bryobacteraceae bacterium]|jgi:CheY-like chemotaxis protein